MYYAGEHAWQVVSEDYLLDNLPDGWTYDCHWGDDGSWFVIINPEGERYALAFCYVGSDGEPVWLANHVG